MLVLLVKIWRDGSSTTILGSPLRITSFLFPFVYLKTLSCYYLSLVSLFQIFMEEENKNILEIIKLLYLRISRKLLTPSSLWFFFFFNRSLFLIFYPFNCICCFSLSPLRFSCTSLFEDGKQNWILFLKLVSSLWALAGVIP